MTENLLVHNISKVKGVRLYVKKAIVYWEHNDKIQLEVQRMMVITINELKMRVDESEETKKMSDNIKKEPSEGVVIDEDVEGAATKTGKLSTTKKNNHY